MEDINTKKYRLISLFGLAFCVLGLFLIISERNNSYIYFGMFLSIVGWLIFSQFHTKIAIYELKKITKCYINEIKSK